MRGNTSHHTAEGTGILISPALQGRIPCPDREPVVLLPAPWEVHPIAGRQLQSTNGYPSTAIGYLPTAIGYTPTAIGYPLTAIVGRIGHSEFFFLSLRHPLAVPMDSSDAEFDESLRARGSEEGAAFSSQRASGAASWPRPKGAGPSVPLAPPSQSPALFCRGCGSAPPPPPPPSVAVSPMGAPPAVLSPSP